MGRHYFEVITDISSDAESCEEQNGASHFYIGATTAKFSKGMQAKRKKKDFFCCTLSLPEDG